MLSDCFLKGNENSIQMQTLLQLNVIYNVNSSHITTLFATDYLFITPFLRTFTVVKYLKNNNMNLQRLSKHIADNSLTEQDISSLLRKEIEPAIGHQYSKGYLRSIRDSKRLRERRKARLDGEFKRSLDFISDLTHDKA